MLQSSNLQKPSVKSEKYFEPDVAIINDILPEIFGPSENLTFPAFRAFHHLTGIRRCFELVFYRP